MGGYGSGLHRSTGRRATVEESLTLSAGDWSRWGVMTARPGTAGSFEWYRGPQEDRVRTGSIGYRVTGPGEVMLLYRWGGDDGRDMSYPVRVESVPIPNGHGGVRWWLLCPLCDRRVGKIHLPPGADRFGCRTCHRLTYESCRESRKYDGLWRDLAASTGRDVADVRRVMARLSRRWK